MSDSFVTQDSFLSRLGSSIKGILVGIVLFVVAFPLLWWNEGRAVRTAKGLKELGTGVVAAAAEKIDPANDGKPVHATALATTDETLADPQFPISAPALKLHRKVEMYQWDEDVKRKRRGRKEYTYKLDWHDALIDSSDFQQPDGHQNPSSMRLAEHEEIARQVSFGSRRLSPGLLEQMDEYQQIAIGQGDLDQCPEEIKRQAKLRDGVIYLPNDPAAPPADPQNPKVGDLRITFELVKPATVSVIARQAGDSFEPWKSQAGTEVERLEIGTVSAVGMVEHMEAENATLTWLLRGAGFLVMAIGIGLLGGPIATVTEVIPVVGGITRFAIAMVAGVAAAALSLVTVASAWLFYRPVLGVALLLGAAAFAVAAWMLVKRMRGASQPPALPPLPPMV